MIEAEKIYRDESLVHLLQETHDAMPPLGMEDRIMAAITAESQVSEGINKNLRRAWISSLSTAASILLLLVFKPQISTFLSETTLLSSGSLSTSMVIVLSTIILGILFLEIDPLISFMIRKRRAS